MLLLQWSDVRFLLRESCYFPGQVVLRDPKISPGFPLVFGKIWRGLVSGNVKERIICGVSPISGLIEGIYFLPRRFSMNWQHLCVLGRRCMLFVTPSAVRVKH